MMRTSLCLFLFSLLVSTAFGQVDRKTKVENDRVRFRDSTNWIYNDLNQARDFAKASNKPLLVVLRCVP